MILLAGDVPDRLELIASRGYPEGGVGSEVGFGEGIIGMVAEARKPIRISGMLRQMLYAKAVGEHARARGLCPEERRIPLPGLAEPETQLGIPLLVRDELVGVLCVETDRDYRFHEEDRTYLEVLGGYLAIAIQNALLRERADEWRGAAAEARSRAVRAGPPRAAAGRVLQPRRDDPGRRRVPRARRAGEGAVEDPARARGSDGSAEFTNRRLRLDRALGLPEFKDNLESRLILLRRRLEERCPEIRIVQSGRGRFRLELAGPVELAPRA